MHRDSIFYATHLSSAGWQHWAGIQVATSILVVRDIMKSSVVSGVEDAGGGGSDTVTLTRH